MSVFADFFSSDKLRDIDKILSAISTPSLKSNQTNLCTKDLSETDLCNAMRTMQNDKSHGNDVPTKQLFKAFEDEIKELLILNSIKIWVFFGENVEKKHLRHHDNNYYYFWKSNIPVINLSPDSRNMIKLSKNMSL